MHILDALLAFGAYFLLARQWSSHFFYLLKDNAA